MSTLTALYIKTQDKEKLISALQDLTGLKKQSEVQFPTGIHVDYIISESATPTWLAIGNTQSDWITIYHNTLNKLTDWGIDLSKKLNTKAIIIAAQSVSDSYYFSFFEKGKKSREIEVCYSDDFEAVNFGEKFPFENNKIEDDDYYFDFKEIEAYCEHFGLQTQYTTNDTAWTILKSKPWWKFW